MILEFITFVLFAIVLVLKYGTVTRIVRLKQLLREAEGRCRKQRDTYRVFQAERLAAEREQTGLIRQRRILNDELTRINTELELFKEESRGMIQELIGRNATIDPTLMPGNEQEPEGSQP